tara:strand:+ start:761 stop:2866 length:2106 start_codon:yes stop_codon:yes gene_type:complete
MFGTIRKHSQSMWIVIIIVIVISFVVFFTPSVDVRDWFEGGRADSGISSEEVAAQREVMVGDMMEQLPYLMSATPQQPPSKPDKVDFDFNIQMMQFNPEGMQKEGDRVAYEALVRLRLLEKAKELGIEFSEETVVRRIEQQFMNENGLFDVNLYQNTVLQFLRRNRLTEDDFRRYRGNEMVLQQLHEVMGASGSFVSTRAVQPLAEQALKEQHTAYEMEVALVKPADFNGSVNNATAQLPGYYEENYKEDIRTRYVWVKLGFEEFAKQPGASENGQAEAAQRMKKLAEQLKAQGGTVDALRSIITADSSQPVLEVEQADLSPSERGQHRLSSVFSQVDVGRTNFVYLERPIISNVEKALFLAGVERDNIEVPLPKFETLTPEKVAEIRKKFIGEKSVELANDAGRTFHTNITTGLDANQTFASLCNANATFQLVSLPPLSAQTKPDDPAMAKLTEHQLDLQTLLRSASFLAGDDSNQTSAKLGAYSSATDSAPGYILFLRKQIPPDLATLKEDLAREVRLYREAHARSSTRAPGSRPHMMTGRNWPDWMRREVELIQLEVFIGAKQRRLEEIEEILRIEGDTLKDKLAADPNLKQRLADIDAQYAKLKPDQDKLEKELEELGEQRQSGEGDQTAIGAKTQELHIQMQMLNLRMRPIQQQRMEIMGQIPALEMERDKQIPDLIRQAQERQRELGVTPSTDAE